MQDINGREVHFNNAAFMCANRHSSEGLQISLKAGNFKFRITPEELSKKLEIPLITIEGCYLAFHDIKSFYYEGNNIHFTSKVLGGIRTPDNIIMYENGVVIPFNKEKFISYFTDRRYKLVASRL